MLRHSVQFVLLQKGFLAMGCSFFAIYAILSRHFKSRKWIVDQIDELESSAFRGFDDAVVQDMHRVNDLVEGHFTRRSLTLQAKVLADQLASDRNADRVGQHTTPWKIWPKAGVNRLVLRFCENHFVRSSTGSCCLPSVHGSSW